MNNQTVVSLRIRLARNLKQVIFPTNEKFTFEDAQYVVSKVKNVFSNFNGFYVNNNLAHALLLKEEHLLSSELIDSNNGYILYNQDKTQSIMLNEEDHIRLQVFSNTGTLSQLLEKAKEMHSKLKQQVQLARQDDIGYITACPTNIGTGLRASAMLFLPALTKLGNMPSLISKLHSSGYVVRGYFGESSQESGFMYQISNKTSFGETQEQIVSKMDQIVKIVTRNELEARQKLVNNNFVELTDEVMRAYGVLTNCYKLSTTDFFNLFGLVKLGSQLGIIKKQINLNLLQEVQPAHLMQIYNTNMTDLQRDITRAQYVAKNLLKGDY